MNISVIVPLYNKEQTILRAINSAIHQTFQPKEIIIVDDGSTDKSIEIIRTINDKNIKVIQQSNSGVSAARNKGIENSNGDWIALLDADDEWMPEYLNSINNLHNKYPACDVLATSYIMRNEHSEDSNITINKLNFSECGIVENYFKVASNSSPFIWTSAVVVNRAALIEVGCFPVGIKSGEDLLTWAKLAIKYQIAYCKVPLAIYYLNSPDLTRKERNRSLLKNNRTVLSEFIKMKDHVDQKVKSDYFHYIAEWEKICASHYFQTGEKIPALQSTLKSIWLRPLKLKTYLYLSFLFLPIKIINRLYSKIGTNTGV